MYGIDYIGIKGCLNSALKAHPRAWALGALAEASGWKPGYAAINRICKERKVPAARIHLMWKDNHRFTQRDIQETVRRAQRLARVIKKHPQVCWYVSPWLEPSGVSKELYAQVITACKMSLPDNVTMVTNSMEGVRVSGCLAEGHHSWYRREHEIFSYDGLECTDANMQMWKDKAKNAQFFFLWRYSCNGKFGPEDKRKRADRDDYIEPKEIRSLRSWTKKRKNQASQRLHL